MPTPSIRSGMLRHACLASLALGLVAWLAAEWTARERFAAEARTTVDATAANLRTQLLAGLAAAGADEAAAARLAGCAAASGGRFQLLRADGTSAAQGGSPVGTVEEAAASAALFDGDGAQVGVLRHVPAEARLERALREARSAALLAALGGFALALALVRRASRQVLEPLDELEQGARRLASGAEPAPLRLADGPQELHAIAASMNSLAGALGERVASLSRARAELEAVLGSMAEGVVAVDSDERVLLMNSAAARLLSLDAPPASGLPLWTRVRHAELELRLRQVLSDGRPWTGDAGAPRADGLVLGLSIAPIEGAEPAGRPAGAVVLLSDVTSVRRLEQVRIDFVANVSHELRTPLAAIMGALETLSEPDADPETVRRFLELANRNATRLQAIVNDLLDLSKIEAEAETMAVEPLRADVPLRTAAGALAGAAEAKGVALELPPPLAADVQVAGHAQRLEQVFTNLLENAIKYTPAGGRVSVRAVATPREVRFEVQDTGIGIPAASLPRVFERFYRVDRSRARDMGGTGLGLAIVKHAVKAHGGTVSATSEEGRGSCFRVSLPRLDPAARRGA